MHFEYWYRYRILTGSARALMNEMFELGSIHKTTEAARQCGIDLSDEQEIVGRSALQAVPPAPWIPE